MKRLLILASSLMISPTYVLAQRHAMMPSAPHEVVAAPRVAVHAGPPSGAHFATRMHTAARTSGTHSRGVTTIVRPTRHPNNPQPRVPADQLLFDSDFYPVPGFGFDVPHLAATRGRRAVEPHGRGRGSMGFFPFFNGGFFLPTTSFIEEAPAADTQQAESAPTETPETVRRVQTPEEAPIATTYAEAAPVREAEEYVFVRRDGTVFFAVGYVWENGTLRYVTREGLRRSVARDLLDLDATQQFNEQRGLNFRVPA